MMDRVTNMQKTGTRRINRVLNIFFDIDDTLFPTSEFAELARKNAIRAMTEQGIEIRAERLYAELMKIIKKRGSNYPHLFDELCKQMKIKRPARFVAAAIAAYHNTKTSIIPYPEVPRVLLRLRELGHKLYIATNGESVKQWDKLIRMGIEMYFTDVFVSTEMGEEKSKRFFERVVKQLKTKPEHCIMIGDREDKDIAPAQKAGFVTVRIRRGKHAKGKTAADFDIKDLRKIESLLKC